MDLGRIPACLRYANALRAGNSRLGNPALKFRLLVDLGGIGPPSRQCECRVLPLNYRPFVRKAMAKFSMGRSANVPDWYRNRKVSIYQSQSRYTKYGRDRVMPLYYRPEARNKKMIPSFCFEQGHVSFRYRSLVGALGIEPKLRSPEPRVLPLYYAPKPSLILCTIKANGNGHH